jgi:hypothetical protein
MFVLDHRKLLYEVHDVIFFPFFPLCPICLNEPWPIQHEVQSLLPLRRSVGDREPTAGPG